MEGPLARLAATFGTLPPYDSFLADSAVRESIGTVLDEVAGRMGDNYPCFHPLYAGQMMKPPHPVARAAYAMAINRFGVFSGRPELDIVVWQVLAESAERRSALAQGIFDRKSELDLHLALVQLPDSLFATRVGGDFRYDDLLAFGTDEAGARVVAGAIWERLDAETLHMLT